MKYFLLMFRLSLVALLFLWFWPEFNLYQNEWRLSTASAKLSPVMTGENQSPSAARDVQNALQIANEVQASNQNDSRAILIKGVALILLDQADAAVKLFKQANTTAERPEFSLNLGRANSRLGNETATQAAFLRAAWSSENAIASLPKDLRENLLQQVAELETQMQTGQFVIPIK